MKQFNVKLLILLLLLTSIMAPGMPALSQDTQSNTFRDFFMNPDYSDPTAFLKCGIQTRATEAVEVLAGNVNGSNDFEILKQIFDAVCSVGDIGNTGEKFTRTVTEIVNEGLSGCTDYALVFASIARLKGIPSIVVDAARMDWVVEYITNTGSPNSIRGHVFVECYMNGTWYLVDSTAGKVYMNYCKENFCLPEGYYVFAKCTELFETGVNNLDTRISSMRTLFKGFDYTKYKEPFYSYYDLRDGMKLKMNTPFSYYSNYLVGGKAVVDALRAKYPGIGNSYGLSESVMFNNPDYKNNYPNANIIEFYQLNSPFYYTSLLPEFPELLTAQPGTIYKNVASNGRFRILLVGNDVNQLIDMIKNSDLTSAQELNNNVLISMSPAARQVAVEGPDIVFIPRNGLCNIEYTSAIKDQFGSDMNEVIVWKITDSNYAPVTGLSISEDGRLHIGPDASKGTYIIKVIPRSAPSVPGYKVIEVVPEPNAAPVLDPIANQIIDEGDLLQFTIHATDRNRDTLTYSASNLPKGSVFDAATGQFKWTPEFDQAGKYESVKFTATDGELTSSVEISIIVKDKSASSLIEKALTCIQEMKLENDTENSLAASLKNASKSIEKKHFTPAENQLNAFGLKLDAFQKSKKLSHDQYNLLYKNLEKIKAALDCEK